MWIRDRLTNAGNLTLNGLELSSDWRPAQAWRFQLSFTYNDVDRINADQADVALLVLPKTIASLRASWTPSANVNVDMWWRHVDERKSIRSEQVRKPYSSLDLRLGWKPRKNVELALIGQNLTDGECAALDGLALAYEISGSVVTCIPRVFGIQARLDF